MASRMIRTVLILVALVSLAALPVTAQSFRVQCPDTTITHTASSNNVEPNYTTHTTFTTGSRGYGVPSNVNGAIKCQQISGGDGYATMADGNQIFMFAFGPLSGLVDIMNGLPGTEFPNVFNDVFPSLDLGANPANLSPGDPATTINASGPGSFTFNGAVGLTGEGGLTYLTPGGVTATGTATIAGSVVENVTITNPGSGYFGPVSVTFSPPPGVDPSNTPIGVVTTDGLGHVTGVTINFAGFYYTTAPTVTFSPPLTGCVASPLTQCQTGHVDPRQIMDIGVMNGNIPAPLFAFDEDDEFFLTLTNVGMIMRPDLFEQHTVHFHGYPNASSFYDGVPDASVAINIGGSFTYYYLAPDAGTYFWHCHITPPEHLQMGMVGQLYVRPRQNRIPADGLHTLYAGLVEQQKDLRTACRRPGDNAGLPSVSVVPDVLCSNPLPASNSIVRANDGHGNPVGKYAYNDGDGSTYYDIDVPIQIHGFDPNFHFVGMTFNPEGFVDMKDKYFLLNGRSYPDTVTPGPMQTESSDGRSHFSQPLPTLITLSQGQKALLRIDDLDVSEYQTLASLGIRMHVIGFNAKLLRDQAGNNLDFYTNSITLAGGESLDVILDSTGVPKGTYYLYTPQLDHLSNDAENFGGLMTEVIVQ